MPGGGGATPGTPSAKQKEKPMIRPKVVVALYNYNAIESGDLSLEKVSYKQTSSSLFQHPILHIHVLLFSSISIEIIFMAKKFNYFATNKLLFLYSKEDFLFLLM